MNFNDEGSYNKLLRIVCNLFSWDSVPITDNIINNRFKLLDKESHVFPERPFSVTMHLSYMVLTEVEVSAISLDPTAIYLIFVPRLCKGNITWG